MEMKTYYCVRCDPKEKEYTPDEELRASIIELQRSNLVLAACETSYQWQHYNDHQDGLSGIYDHLTNLAESGWDVEQEKIRRAILRTKVLALQKQVAEPPIADPVLSPEETRELLEWEPTIGSSENQKKWDEVMSAAGLNQEEPIAKLTQSFSATTRKMLEAAEAAAAAITAALDNEAKVRRLGTWSESHAKDSNMKKRSGG